MKKALRVLLLVGIIMGWSALVWGQEAVDTGAEPGDQAVQSVESSVDDPLDIPGEGDAVTSEEGDAVKTPQQPSWMSWAPFILMFVILYFFIIKGPKKKQKEHQRMLNELKRGDKVRTIGGLFGSVVDIRDDEVVLKVDESTNTKMRVARNAVGKVLTDDGEGKE